MIVAYLTFAAGVGFLVGTLFGCLTTHHLRDESDRRNARANRRMDFIHGDNQVRCFECGATLGGHTGYCSRSAMMRGDLSGYGPGSPDAR